MNRNSKQLFANGLGSVSIFLCKKEKLRDFLYRFSSGAVFQTLDAQKYFNSIVRDSTVISNFIDLSNYAEPISWNQRKSEIVSVGRLTKCKESSRC